MKSQTITKIIRVRLLGYTVFTEFIGNWQVDGHTNIAIPNAMPLASLKTTKNSSQRQSGK